jgi:hypothetical protein
MYLVNTDKFNNFNFEFFKLKTLDTIISKLSYDENDEYQEDINVFFTRLVIYIENNKIASQIFHIYSRLYLSLACYYSKSFEKYCIELSMEYFIMFLKM